MGTLAMGTLLSPLPAMARREESPAKIEAQYQNESDPVRRAKLLAKLGPLEMTQAHMYVKGDDAMKALVTVEHYRDEVRKTTDDLAAAKVNTAKHPSGYKELQIGLRESIRRLNDVILLLPVDERSSFEAARSDLTTMQAALFEALFPTAAEKGENRRAQQ
jgi:hypothetical protein